MCIQNYYVKTTLDIHKPSAIIYFNESLFNLIRLDQSKYSDSVIILVKLLSTFFKSNSFIH